MEETPMADRTLHGRRDPGPQAERVLAAVEGGACHFVDLHFTDVTGAVKSVGLPAVQLRDAIHYGHWFDGSALEGGARTMETDLLLWPDLATWCILPWADAHGERTGRVICDVQTPDGEPYPLDARSVLRRVLLDADDLNVRYMVAPELEFFLFRTGGRRETVSEYLAAGPADTGGYFDLAAQQGGRVRDEIVRALSAVGIAVEASHHEIAPGQHEIDLPLLPALEAADALVTCKYVIKTLARQRGLIATFMPKPLPDTAGSGLHLHQAITDADGTSALADPADENGLSARGRAFIAGQLVHARAMCSVLAPTVNSYKRIGRGFDAPSYLTWSHSNPFAVIRVPRPVLFRRRDGVPAGGRAEGDAAMRVELRCPDPSCNPYLALAVALAAGLDGVRAGLEPPAPPDEDASHPAALEESQVEVLPASLGEALGELEWDPVIRGALGAPVYERLLTAKEQEWQEYRRQVSAWELDRYFESA
jgi:glutamine synthetase